MHTVSAFSSGASDCVAFPAGGRRAVADAFNVGEGRMRPQHIGRTNLRLRRMGSRCARARYTALRAVRYMPPAAAFDMFRCAARDMSGCAERESAAFRRVNCACGA